MPQAEELEEAEIGEVEQAEVEAGRFEFPKPGIDRKVEAILPDQRHSQLHVWHWQEINFMSFVPQLQHSCWKDEQEQLLEKETGDEQIVDEQSDKAGK